MFRTVACNTKCPKYCGTMEMIPRVLYASVNLDLMCKRRTNTLPLDVIFARPILVQQKDFFQAERNRQFLPV